MASTSIYDMTQAQAQAHTVYAQLLNELSLKNLSWFIYFQKLK